MGWPGTRQGVRDLAIERPDLRLVGAGEEPRRMIGSKGL